MAGATSPNVRLSDPAQNAGQLGQRQNMGWMPPNMINSGMMGSGRLPTGPVPMPPMNGKMAGQQMPNNPYSMQAFGTPGGRGVPQNPAPKRSRYVSKELTQYGRTY